MQMNPYAAPMCVFARSGSCCYRQNESSLNFRYTFSSLTTTPSKHETPLDVRFSRRLRRSDRYRRGGRVRLCRVSQLLLRRKADVTTSIAHVLRHPCACSVLCVFFSCKIGFSDMFFLHLGVDSLLAWPTHNPTSSVTYFTHMWWSK